MVMCCVVKKKKGEAIFIDWLLSFKSVHQSFRISQQGSVRKEWNASVSLTLYGPPCSCKVSQNTETLRCIFEDKHTHAAAGWCSQSLLLSPCGLDKKDIYLSLDGLRAGICVCFLFFCENWSIQSCIFRTSFLKAF